MKNFHTIEQKLEIENEIQRYALREIKEEKNKIKKIVVSTSSVWLQRDGFQKAEQFFWLPGKLFNYIQIVGVQYVCMQRQSTVDNAELL